METKSFFNEEATQQAIAGAILIIGNLQASTEFEKLRNEIVLGILNGMQQYPKLWDKNCQFNIQHIADDFIDNLSEKNHNEYSLNLLCLQSYRFLYEHGMCAEGSIAVSRVPNFSHVEEFLHKNIDNFSPNIKSNIRWTLHGGMIISVINKFKSSEEIKTAHEFVSSEKNLEELVSQIKEREEYVKHLENSFEEYKDKFNFVGLYAGFDKLSADKNIDKKRTLISMIQLGFLAIFPLFLELFIVILIDVSKIDNTKIVIISLICASLTAITLYYFRIALLNYNSIKAQLIQVELRKTLCRFIQNYSEHSAEIKKNDKDALDKFENIIFSNIVAGDDKIPSTFDGIEQLAKLIEAVKGKNK